MDKEGFELDRTIDPSQLDVECVRQADLFFKYAEMCVYARSEVERQKLGLDVLEAKLQARVREDPEKYSVAKVTEAAIAAAVQIHPQFRAASEEYLKAREELALLEVAREAMNTKKSMLEGLIKLHGQEYFGGPSVPHNLPEAWAKHQKKVEDGVNKRQGGKTRHRKEA